LSFKNTAELNKIIDKEIPVARPQFIRQELLVEGKAYDVYYRDIIECIKALFGDPSFDSVLVLEPEHHYEDATCDKDKHIYHDMHTGCWWWDVQVSIN
jgi:hypothetical protein